MKKFFEPEIEIVKFNSDVECIQSIETVDPFGNIAGE